MRNLIFLLLISTSSGILITCRFHWNATWSVIGQVYNCEVISEDFSDNSTHVTGVNGTHMSGRSNADVKMIWFSANPSSNLKVIPKGFLNFFPNFIAFNFNTRQIDFLKGDELEEYPSLQYYLQYNSNLTRVPGNFFASTKNMSYVHLSNNKIQNVGEGLLDNLKNLQKVYFKYNTCISKEALGSTQIPALIEDLRVNCTDIETTTKITTTTTTSTTTAQPSRCGINNLDDFVCELDEENEFLKNELKITKTEIDQVNLRYNVIQGQYYELINYVEALNLKVNELSSRT
jgi:hypothetical protein